jgi:transposase InsO family protein
MAWMESCLMNERMIFIAACLAAEGPFSQICLRLGISRKTGYKWRQRYELAGAAGLCDLSSARHTQLHAITPGVADRLLALRRLRPTWGPRKLLARLTMDDSATDWPAPSTVGDLLRRHDLSKPRPRRRHRAGGKPALTQPEAANESWAIDFKGWFRTGDGVRCEPLTVTDGYSRYLMVCQAVPQTTGAYVRPILVQTFQTHGMPRALRSDNGNPFASAVGLAGLTQLSVWLLTLNIWPERIDPGRPDQNGRHERMHRVLNEDAARPPAATLAAQQLRLDAWRLDYNNDRPHEALGQRCPATLYTPSPRAYPDRIADWDYPADHRARRVNGRGYIKWRDRLVYLTEALAGQTVALAQDDDGDWSIRFRQFSLAMLSDATNMIRPSGLARTGWAAPTQVSALLV